jgi:hypothetical protein
MCAKTFRAYVSCNGTGLAANQGLQVGNRRKHFFAELAACTMVAQAHRAAEIAAGGATLPVAFYPNRSRHVNLNTGTSVKYPHCLILQFDIVYNR